MATPMSIQEFRKDVKFFRFWWWLSIIVACILIWVGILRDRPDTVDLQAVGERKATLVRAILACTDEATLRALENVAKGGQP